MHQHFEGVGHGGVEELVEGVAVGRELAGFALDEIGDEFLAGI